MSLPTKLDLTSEACERLAHHAAQLGFQMPVDSDSLQAVTAAALIGAGVTDEDGLKALLTSAVEGRYDKSDAHRAAVIARILGMRFCGLPDGGLSLLQFGAAGVPWDDRHLTWRVDSTGAELLDPLVGLDRLGGGAGNDVTAVVREVVRRSFELWEDVLQGHFSFSEVTSDPDIEIDFSSSLLDGPVGTGIGPREYMPGMPYRQTGRIRIDRWARGGASIVGGPWTESSLGFVVTHEIGHVLGLQHSNTPGSVMYPYANPAQDGWDFWPIDYGSSEALRDMYGWQHRPFRDERTSAYPPSLARTIETAGLGGGPAAGRPILHMVWTGPQGVPGLSYSQSRNGGRAWTAATSMSWPPGATPVHGTALTAYALTDDPAPNGLFLAWAGENEQLWYASDLSDPASYGAFPLVGLGCVALTGQ